MRYTGKARCICDTAIEIAGIRPAIVSEDEDIEIRTDIWLEVGNAIDLAYQGKGLELDTDKIALTIATKIYERLGLVVEEIPDAIPDPEGGMMKA